MLTPCKLAVTSVAFAGLVLACSTSAPEARTSPVEAAAPEAAAADAAVPDDAAPDDAAPDVSVPSDASADAFEKPVTRVLFIGNSYTAVNDLPAVLSELGESAQSPVTFQVAQHTPGGTSWETHDGNPAVDALIQQGWDVVVLQDQSAQPWLAKGIKPALVSLDSKIESTGAETLLYMTWARVKDPNIYPSNYAMEMAVNHYYERHAAAVGARVAPVGRAWERALRNPSQSLHAADGSHPNARGTYLAACVFYATLTEQSPIGLGNGGLAVTDAERAELQQVAWDTHVSRLRLPSPAIGSWPLSAAGPSQDFVPTAALDIGGVAGPGTQFGPNQYGAIPYFAGIDSPELTFVVHAYRDDWSVWTTSPETLVGKSWAYSLRHNQLYLEGSLYTTNATDSGAFVKYAVDGLSPGWHQLALTYDGATFTLWVDAQPVASDANVGEVRYYAQSPDEVARYDAVAIGANTVDTALTNASPGPLFTGALAGVRMFDQALGQADLQALSP